MYQGFRVETVEGLRFFGPRFKCRGGRVSALRAQAFDVMVWVKVNDGGDA